MHSTYSPDYDPNELSQARKHHNEAANRLCVAARHYVSFLGNTNGVPQEKLDELIAASKAETAAYKVVRTAQDRLRRANMRVAGHAQY